VTATLMGAFDMVNGERAAEIEDTTPPRKRNAAPSCRLDGSTSRRFCVTACAPSPLRWL